MRTIHKKKTKLTAATLAMLVGGGVAIAYWTGGGTGAGEARTGTTTALEVVQSSTITNLKPGGAAQTLSGKFKNPNSSPVFVANVTVGISDVVKAVGAPAGPCTVADYTLGNPTMTVGQEVPTGENVGDWTGATIQFNNKADANQDGCKGATVKLAYTIS